MGVGNPPDSVEITKTFYYGSDGQRVLMVSKRNDTIVSKKYYIGEYELTKNIEVPSLKEVSFISTPTGLVAAEVKIDTVPTLYYILTDQLGSITQLLDSNGYALSNARFTYDAWGRLRDVRNTTDHYKLDDIIANFNILGRGYTGHEHLLEHSVINMNGRIYDPLLGQFMQADNYIQSPENFLDHNRYAYCRNNPFKYTDPSGEEYVSEIDSTSGGGSVAILGDDPVFQGCDPKPDDWVDPPGPVRISVMDGTVYIYGPGTSLFGRSGATTVPSQTTGYVAGGGGGSVNVIITNELYKALNTKANISGGKEAFVLGAIVPVYGDSPDTWGQLQGYNLVFTDINIGTTNDRYGNLNILDAIKKDGRFSLNNVYIEFHTHTEGSFSNGDMRSLAINTFNNYKDPELAINLTRNGFVYGAVTSNYVELLVVNSSETYVKWYKNEMGKYIDRYKKHLVQDEVAPAHYYINLIKSNNNGSSGLYYYKFKWR